MTEDPETRIAGLRGLYIEAEREGEQEAARLIAERAREESPATPWAARALLRHQTAAADWDGALRTLSGAADGRVLDKRTARRQRAVILTAEALDKEDGEPDRAAPCGAGGARAGARPRAGRRRGGAAAVAAGRHPPRHAHPGGGLEGRAASRDRRRLHACARRRFGERPAEARGNPVPHAPQADEGRLAVARAAIDARDFARAREVLTPVLTTRPTQNALMLDGGAGGGGDRRPRPRPRMAGARRARAARPGMDGRRHRCWRNGRRSRPRPGRLDAVEWKVPVAELAPPQLAIDAAELEPPAPPPPPARPPPPEPDRAAAPHRGAAARSGPAGAAARPFARRRSAARAAAAAPAGSAPDAHQEREARAGAAPDRQPAARSTLDETIPPPHGAVPAGSAREAEDPAKPRLPDDPGIAEESEPEAAARRFKIF